MTKEKVTKAKVAKPRGKKKDVEAPVEVVEAPREYPYVVVGSHLTVTHFADGTVSLEWDDEALEREVREAIASVQ